MSKNQLSTLFIPKEDPFFYTSSDIMTLLDKVHKISKKHPVNVLVAGKQGCGKSSIVKQYAAVHQAPLATFQVGILSEPGQLFGEYALEGGETKYKQFLFPQALQTPGCVIHLEEIQKLGDKSTPIAEIHLNNVRVPKENLLGKWGQGFKVAMTALDRGRISVASGAVGLAQACLEAAIDYAKQRTQFGRPIATYQMVKSTIAEMVSQIEAARLLVQRGAWLNDQGRPFTREIAIAKYVAGEAVVSAAGKAMEIFGGNGYSLLMPLERYYRDAKLYQIGEGTVNIMKLLIGNDALGIKKANRPRLHPPAEHADMA